MDLRAEARLSIARALLAEGARSLVQSHHETMLHTLSCFESSVYLAPSLRVHAWEQGFAFYYNGQYEQAAELFALNSRLDNDDVEPSLWRFMAEAKVSTPQAAQKLLFEFTGWDRRLAMMQILDLFKGNCTVTDVLDMCSGDPHATARACFNSALYQEAIGKEHEALSLLRAATESQFNGDVYMLALASCHRRALGKRVGAQGVPLVTSKLGLTLPVLIHGTWQLSATHQVDKRAGWQREEKEQAALLQILENHVAVGINAFDCGDIYTGVEDLIGRYLQDYRQVYVHPRHIQVHTKFVPDYDVLKAVDDTYVRAVIERSLNRLRVGYLYLVQMHWWDFNVPRCVEVARVLAELVTEGKIKHLGVTNFDRRHLAELLDAGLQIVSNQVQVSLLDRRAVISGLTTYAQSQGVCIIAYGVLAGGFLTDAWLGKAQPDVANLSNRSLIKYLLIIEEWGGWGALQALLRVLRRVADRHQTTIAAVAIRWVLDIGGVTSAIIGSHSMDHIPSTVGAVTHLRLTKQDREEIDVEAIAAERRVPGDVYELERTRDGKHGQIMKYNLSDLHGADHLEDLVERFLDGIFRHFPHQATSAGVHRYDHLLSHPSKRARRTFVSWAKRLIAELKSIEIARLNPDQAVDHALMISYLRYLLLQHCNPQHQLADIASQLLEALTSLLSERHSGNDAPSISTRAMALSSRLLTIPHILLQDVPQSLNAMGPLPEQLAAHASNTASALAKTLSAQEGPLWEALVRVDHSLPLYIQAAVLSAQSFARLVIRRNAEAGGGAEVDMDRKCEWPASAYPVEGLSTHSIQGSLNSDVPGGGASVSDYDSEYDSEKEAASGMKGGLDTQSVVAVDEIVSFPRFHEADLTPRSINHNSSDMSVSASLPDTSTSGGAAGTVKRQKSPNMVVGRQRMEQYVALLHQRKAPQWESAEIGEQGGAEVDDREDRPAMRSLSEQDGQLTLDALMEKTEKHYSHILRELQDTAAQIDATKTWQEVMDAVKNEYPQGSQLFEHYLTKMKRAQEHAIENKCLGAADIRQAKIRAICNPATMHHCYPIGDLIQPAPFASDRAATLMLPCIADDDDASLRHHDKHQIELIAVRDFYPGHYYQSLLAHEHARSLRRWYICPRFYEGWSLYCEQLAYETGYYTEPLKARLSQYRLQLWRAARVFLDLKINCSMLSFRECCNFLQEHLMFSASAAARETMTYILRPGYAMSHYSGYCDICQLREERQMIEGEQFDRAAFHHDLLRHGAIPPTYIAWLNQVSHKSA